MSSYEEVVEKDLLLLRSIQDYCRRTPWLNYYMSRIVSKNPLRDVVSILWLFFIYGLAEIGAPHFWVVVMNLVGAFILRSFLEAKRPVEYDIRLQPLTDKGAMSFGFPSLESHLSVVIMGHLFFSFKSILLLPVGLLTVGVIGFSRVYSRARFPHQVVGSWLTGIIGLVLSMHCCQKMNLHKMTKHQHGVCIIFICIGVLCNVALNIENNDSRLLHLPREEFVKVLSSIISGGDKSTPSTVEPGSSEDGEYYDPMDPAGLGSQQSTFRSSKSSYRTAVTDESPRTAATREAQARPTNGLSMGENNPSGARKRRVKSDSLYFLQRSMEQREKMYREGQNLTARTDDTDWGGTEDGQQEDAGFMEFS